MYIYLKDNMCSSSGFHFNVSQCDLILIYAKYYKNKIEYHIMTQNIMKTLWDKKNDHFSIFYLSFKQAIQKAA